MVLLFVLLTGVAVGSLAYAILQPAIALEKKAESRLSQMKGPSSTLEARRSLRERNQEIAKRRRTLHASLKAVEDKQKQHDRAVAHMTLERRIQQAGLSIGRHGFFGASVGLGVFTFVLALVFGLSLLLALLVGVAAGLALPRWLLRHLRLRRQRLFVDEFANAIDVIVRGIRSGLPLNDTLRMVASEAKEPVASEFRRIVEGQALGLSTSEAVERLYQNMPMMETNFFAIVVSIQSQAGGNLSEALGNLSRVLRDRKKMKAKIQAMSMEAKASGAIIAALPPLVMLFVFLTTPAYILLLFTTMTGNLIMAASLVWMSIGVLVMKKMIAFDF